jgi:hypothetical protein
VLGHLLLIAAVLEGAAILGWRLTQLPKSLAVEFLLVSPVRPPQIVLVEAFAGMARLALLTLAGLPILLLLALGGYCHEIDVGVLLVMPLTWGTVVGCGLTAWAFEGPSVRRWGGRAVLALVFIYLGIGLAAGENLKSWVDQLPAGLGQIFLNGFEAAHRYNPFAVLQYCLEQEPSVAAQRLLGIELVGLAAASLLLARAAWRFKTHFDDLHYEPIADRVRARPSGVGNQPLRWWAVRRVGRYSGRVNLWLAAGFGLTYALYTVAEPLWPRWLGRRAFIIFDQMGGIPVLATALVILAAVPAAFQYGLWDSNIPDRCRRLELLLLTHLSGRDYWEAAFAAACRRGLGYFALAIALWGAAAVAGQMEIWQLLAAMASGVVLWSFYFALGFRAFSRGVQAGGLGLVLSVGVPGLGFLLHRMGWPGLAASTPAANLYVIAASPSGSWLLWPVFGGLTTIFVARLALAQSDMQLRRWYDRHQGRKVID